MYKKANIETWVQGNTTYYLVVHFEIDYLEKTVMSLFQLKYKSSQFDLRSPIFFKKFDIIFFLYFYFSYSYSLGSGGIGHHDCYWFFILFSFMVAFVSIFGVFPNVLSE